MVPGAAPGGSSASTCDERLQEAEGTMIRVKLIDHRLGAKYVDFRAVPLVDPADYRCHPRDLLTFEDAVDLSRQLDCGDVEGYLRHYQWYRQALSRDEWEEAANV
jgi:hypothetical protein